jgi:hypothetical protein
MQLIDALNLSDRELLARTLMAEAGNGSINDMLPVGNVIMNRARQGGTLQDVILAPAQFSPWNTTKMPDGSMLYAAGKGQGRDMGSIKPSNSAYEVADLLLSGEATDVTEGATHFFNPSISKPSWAKGMAGRKIGSHLFGSAGGFRTGAPKIQTQQPLSATSGIGGGSLLSKEPEMSMNPNTPPRSGLLGFMDIMRQQDPETGMTAMERFGAALDPLVRPNERMGEQFRASGARRLQTQSKNKTIETLTKRAQGGDRVAAMVLQGLQTGAYDAKTAMSLYMQEMLKGGTTQADMNKMVVDARKEFTGLQPVKDFSDVSFAYSRVVRSADDPSPAGDLALIFNFMKVLDPGSVVREGEFATAQNAGGVDERLRSIYNQVVDGTRLTETQRADFVDRAGRLYSGAQEQYKSIADQYINFATQAGLDPNLVIPDFGFKGTIPEKPTILQVPPNPNTAQFPTSADWKKHWQNVMSEQDRIEYLEG